MRTKVWIYVVVAVLAAAALVVGIVTVAGADQTNPLPQVSAADLLATMQQHAGQTTTISGDVAWQNNLLGDLSAAMGGSSFGGASAKLPLVASGSGRVWASPGGVRVESQASGGDQVVVASAKGRDVWTYDYAADTATHVVVTGTPPGGGSSPAPMASPSLATPAAITAMLERLAPLAKVEVTGQSTVAGRDVYLLTMTPTATDTALGSVQASIDGKTYVPLQLQVFARGDSSAALQFGFTSVSYDAVPASTFAFTPPAGTKVTTKTTDLSKMTGHAGSSSGTKAEPTKAQQSALQSALKQAFLTVPEAQKLVTYTVYAPQGYTARPFDTAAVVTKGGPLTAAGTPLSALLQAVGLGGSGGAGASTATQVGPTTVLVYGKGFGTIALAETKTTPALTKQLAQLPAIVDKTSVDGATVRSFTTPLGGVVVWQKGETTLVAGGMVPKADLQAFVASVR